MIDSPPEDEQTMQMDELLARMVTLPTDEQPPLVTFDASLQKPPAPGAVHLSGA